MQVIADGFKGHFASLKLMGLERLLICYLFIKVKEGAINGQWSDFFSVSAPTVCGKEYQTSKKKFIS